MKRYVRNICVEAFDIEGQKKLSKSNILVIGLGGLGSYLSYHLAAMGVQNLHLMDKDTVALSNLQRQILYSESSINSNKSDEAKNRLQELNSDINIYSYNSDNVELIIEQVKPDLIFDCTDNYQTRLNIQHFSKSLNIPVCTASAVEWQGWITLFEHNEKYVFEDIFPYREDYANCDDQGILSPIVGSVASMQAMEGIRYLLNLNYNKNILTFFNGFTNDITKIELSKDFSL